MQRHRFDGHAPYQIPCGAFRPNAHGVGKVTDSVSATVKVKSSIIAQAAPSLAASTCAHRTAASRSSSPQSFGGIRVGQFRAEHAFRSRRNRRSTFFLQLARFCDLDELTALAILHSRRPPALRHQPVDQPEVEYWGSASAAPALPAHFAPVAPRQFEQRVHTRPAAENPLFSNPVRPRRAPGSGSASGESRRRSPRSMVGFMVRSKI